MPTERSFGLAAFCISHGGIRDLWSCAMGEGVMKRFGKITKISTSIVTLDAFTALFSGLFISSLALPNLNHSATILVACLFGVIPDLIEAPYYFLQGRLGFLGTSKKENGFIAKVWIPLQKSIQSDVPPFPGLLTQLATTLAAFWWILG